MSADTCGIVADYADTCGIVVGCIDIDNDYADTMTTTRTSTANFEGFGGSLWGGVGGSLKAGVGGSLKGGVYGLLYRAAPDLCRVYSVQQEKHF